MPIKGLTDKASTFPQVGALRKGGEAVDGKRGKDLAHFRFTSDLKEVQDKFASVYGESPASVRVYLPYQTPSENFSAWIENWSKSGLMWRGDGENLVLWRTTSGTYSQETKPQPVGGKQVGRLSVIIPELERLAYVTALTSSIHDIMTMSSVLEQYYALSGDLRGIPFILSRVSKMVSTPTDDGGRARREKFLWHIEADAQWVRLKMSRITSQAMLAAGGQSQVVADFYEDEDEDDDNSIEQQFDVVTSEQAKHLYNNVFVPLVGKDSNAVKRMLNEVFEVDSFKDVSKTDYDAMIAKNMSNDAYKRFIAYQI